MVVHYRKTSFSIDGSDMKSTGWTAGELWNGWACPRFEKDEAIKVMEDFNSHIDEKDLKAKYDEEKDTFYFSYQYGDVIEVDEHEGMIINTHEGPVKVYAIGAGFWVWNDLNFTDLSKYNKMVINGVLLMEED